MNLPVKYNFLHRSFPLPCTLPTWIFFDLPVTARCFQRKFLEVVGWEVNRFQNDYDMVMGEGSKPQNPQIIRERRIKGQQIFKNDHGRVKGTGAKTKYLQMI